MKPNRAISNSIKMILGLSAFAALIATLTASLLLHVRAVPVMSNSMQPYMSRGSLVVTVETRATSLDKGDVIAFPPPEGYGIPTNAPVMHRIVSVERTASTVKIKTRGDANPTDDPWTLEFKSVDIHRAAMVIPIAGRVTAALASRNHAVAAVSIVGFLILLASVMFWPRKSRCCADDELAQQAEFEEIEHALRTPLCSVIASIELLNSESKTLDSSQLQMIEIAERNAWRLNETIAGLLKEPS